MKRLLTLLAALLAAYLVYDQQFNSGLTRQLQAGSASHSSPATNTANGTAAVVQAFQDRRSNVQVEVHGMVSKVLHDDTEGSRHQRFIVSLPAGQSVLVVHNIDLAERINDLRSGEPVTLSGEYEWNAQGGIVHWTHHDPAGRHAPGWIKYHGRLYQ